MKSILTNEKLANLWEEYYSNKERYDRINRGYPFFVEYLDYEGVECAEEWSANTLEREFYEDIVFTFVGLVVDPEGNTDEETFFIG